MLASLAAWRFLKLVDFARLTVVVTLCLIFIGGMVTSHNAGLAVPDWPLSFGTVNPEGWWKIKNVMLEHGHRLFAQFIGLLTTILAIRIWRNDPRKWMRWLGVAAFVGVVLQGVLGGYRVKNLSIILAMIHACTAHAFLCLLIFIAMALATPWTQDEWEFSGHGLAPIRLAGWVLTGSVFVQLIVGAVMRHYSRVTDSGLAFHDFPLTDGHLIPVLDSFGKQIHFAHRVGALWVTVVAVVLIAAVVAGARKERRLLMPAVALMLLLLLQISLGAQVIWLDRPPVAASLHVATGAAILGTSLLLALRASHFKLAHGGEDESFANESILST